MKILRACSPRQSDDDDKTGKIIGKTNVMIFSEKQIFEFCLLILFFFCQFVLSSFFAVAICSFMSICF